MGKIYRHFLFTIASSSAADSSTGFLYRRVGVQWPVRDFCLSRDDEFGTGVKLEPMLPSWRVLVGSPAISQRAWVLQERMLAGAHACITYAVLDRTRRLLGM